MDDLIVQPLPTDKTNLPQSKYMNMGIIPKFPSMLLSTGRSGSGKSTVVNYMMTKPNFMFGFFDQVYLFSKTAKIDDLAKHLKLQDKFLITDPTEKKLKTIIDSQRKMVESKGIKYTAKKNKVMIIFDDIIANPQFLKSKTMLELASMGRHYLISSIINTQSYTKIPRPIRIQSKGLILFPSSNDEIKLLVEDICPAHCDKKRFTKLIEYATRDEHDFLFVNNFASPDKRFRKAFSQYLNPVINK
jgi:hypothetical protein